jgi:hypothetical protein
VRNSAVCTSNRPLGLKSTITGILIAALLPLSACGIQKREERVLFDGQYFRAKAARDSRDQRQNFSVQVSGIDQGFEGALEAGRYEAIRYCIEEFGTSDIIWVSGPDDDADTLDVDRDRLTLRGTCYF